jgi:2-polyprenyl-6-methoxyphenol hydroxylase-like FAD-dependent oxidoreductase
MLQFCTSIAEYMLTQNKQIAIVGGGPGGLTLARLLQQKGATVTLYERDINKDARVQGSPLDMHETSGWAALSKANLLEAFQKNILPGADRKIIVNKRAEILFSDHETQSQQAFEPEYSNPEIARGVLRKILLESLQPETVVWNSHFISMEKQDEGWLLHFKNGEPVYADMVIGADGAHSKIRPYITDIKAFYSGVTMLEITILKAEQEAPHIYALLNGGKVMAFGDGKCILGGQKGNGDLGFYASFKTGETWAHHSGLDYNDHTQMLMWFKQEYPDWSSTWHELFDGATTPFIPRPVYCMPLDQDWETLSHVTLLGDAAHVMPPFAGEGANMAMLDALELSECLTSGNYPNLREAISAYEINMRKRATIAAQQSLENGARMHSPDAPGQMLHIFGKK